MKLNRTTKFDSLPANAKGPAKAAGTTATKAAGAAAAGAAAGAAFAVGWVGEGLAAIGAGLFDRVYVEVAAAREQLVRHRWG